MPELITVTEAAAAKITNLMLEQEKKSTEVGLRIYVQGGGCSGFQYSFTFDNKLNTDDQTIEKDGVTVVIDEISWGFLAGSEIGYKTELIGAYFSIDNPNAASTCGCGTSFAI